MKKSLASLICLIVSLNSFAVDVKPIGLKKGDAYVQVTKLPNKRIKFEKCKMGFEKTTCKGLGHKESYSIKELQKQRNEENTDAMLALLADVGIVAVAVVGWTAALGGTMMVFSTAGTAAVTTGQAIGAGATMLAVTGGEYIAIDAMTSAFDAINPAEQARQRESICEDVVNDYDVEVARADMKKAIERLDFVLSEIK